jgi:hypothetical protein
MFTIPLIECLKRRSLYNVHAAGLCYDGKGILLPGSSGSGKSTLAIALARAGFGFLGDDMLFLTHGTTGLQVLAFPDEIDITDHTATLFPELRSMLERSKPRGWHKRQFLVEELYPNTPVMQCRPRAIVFPRIAHTEHSTLREMSGDEAFLELMPNVLLTKAVHVQAHLDKLRELVQTCACYRLETGQDFDRLPELLRDVIS